MAEDELSQLTIALQLILTAEHQLGVDKAINKIADQYGLKSVAYLGVGFSKFRDLPFLAVTYSADWAERYMQWRYVRIDPVVQHGLRHLLPIDWSEFGEPKGELQSFFGEAAEFGIGRQGLTIPVQGRGSDRSLFSVTSDFSDRDWLDAKFEYMRDL